MTYYREGSYFPSCEIQLTMTLECLREHVERLIWRGAKTYAKPEPTPKLDRYIKRIEYYEAASGRVDIVIITNDGIRYFVRERERRVAK